MAKKTGTAAQTKLSTPTRAAESEPSAIPYYGMRSRSLAWRSQWFQATRGTDEGLLTKARDAAFAHKKRLIVKGIKSGWKAGFDPAGAGSPWYPLGPRNVNGRVKSLAVHPTDANTIYAGAASGGVWKSTDGGQTWDSLWDMQETLAIGALGIARSAPNIIYAGSGEWTPGWGPSYQGAGVYLSTDSGATWSLRNAVQSRRIGKLVVDPTNSQRVWVCGDHGLERSTDGGTTWTTLRAGAITDIALDPANANNVFIGIRYDGFYKSADGGTTFNLLPGSPTGVGVEWPQIAIGVSGTHANNFIVVKTGGTVRTSNDGGSTFTAIPGAHGGFFAGWCDVVACAPDDEQILFWGGVGLDRTANAGTSWSGLPVHSDQHAVVFAPSNSNIVYVANDGGVWRSDDKGATIRKVSNGLVITQFYNINFWSGLSNVVGGGAQDNQTNFTTGGLTWHPVFINDGGWFLIDPTDPHIMYAESQNGNVAKSVDGGQTWASKTAGIVGSTAFEGILTMDPSNYLRLFYGTDRVLRSTDGLATAWTQSSQTLTGTVSAIAVAPSSSNRVYAATGSGKLYRSDDGGNTSPWADKSGTLPARAIRGIFVDPGNPDAVLVSIGGVSGLASAQAVYRTTTGGNAWTDVSGDLPNVVGNAVVVDPSDAITWYLATDTGVYRTTNGGTNWLPFDNGIPNVPVSDLVVDTASKILYCGTMGRGAFKLDITPAVVKASVDVYLRDDDLDTGERFPSPSGLQDPLIAAPGTANFWMSPDIKVNHMPVFTPSGVFDGVDFDATLQHQDPVRGESNRFYVQVQNRGWQTTHNVQVCAFVADASAGLPNLPNALTPPNFDLTSTAAWQPVGLAQTIAELKPNRPIIVSWDYTMPLGSATHTCCLAVVSSPDDPYNNPSSDIVQLITMDKRVCLKNLHVVDPGPGPMPLTMTTIDFHNAGEKAAEIDIIIRPNGFTRGTIGLLLPKVDIDPKRAAQGVEVLPLAPDDPLGKWHGQGGRDQGAGLARRLADCDRTRIFDFDRIKPSALVGIPVGPHQTLTGVLLSSLKNDVRQSGPASYEVVQRTKGKVVGGSTFQFGYPLPRKTAAAPVHYVRVRIVCEDLVRKAQGDVLVSEVRIEEDAARTYQRILGPDKQVVRRPLFDGILIDGQTLRLALMGGDNTTVYQRQFTGPVASWLGVRKAVDAKGVQFAYRIETVDPTMIPPAD
jgi:photosystem II stability/assembly factor-like uncharacterized protein